MTYGSLFSGIGGFDKGFDRAGLQCAWQVENDPNCNRVLRRHWPEVKRYGDITKIDTAQLARPDIVCGGFPCQDLSLAGRRSGLAGERSGLWFEFLRILWDLKTEWVVIENVPGLFSSDRRRDLATILHGLEKCGYRVAWRVLDANGFGVPQRRRRVFLVGHLGDGCAAEVLFESEGMRRDTSKGRKTRTGIAALTADGVGTCGADDNQAQAGHLICHALSSEGADASEDGTGRGTPIVAFQSAAAIMNIFNNIIPPQDVGKGGRMAIMFQNKASVTQSMNPSDLCPTIDTCKPEGLAITCIKGAAIGRKPEAGPQWGEFLDDGSMYTQNATEQHAVAGYFGVRRLMPIECERAQGFPDNWTKYGMDENGKRVTLSDSARYRMIGNAVVPAVAEWIAERILTANESK